MIQKRLLSYKSLTTWYSSLTKPKKCDPPYRHVVQIGDPDLRTQCDKIPSELITSKEIQFLIRRMRSIFEKFNCCGLSANQIGIPLRIFIMEFSNKHRKDYSKEQFTNMDMSLTPQKVVINPVMKILDYEKVTFPESCASIKGFYAEVPRYRAIKLTGLNESAENISMDLKGWTARIVQHEMDHLNGVLYTDIMDRRSLTCSCWQVVNERNGKVEIPFYK